MTEVFIGFEGVKRMTSVLKTGLNVGEILVQLRHNSYYSFKLFPMVVGYFKARALSSVNSVLAALLVGNRKETTGK